MDEELANVLAAVSLSLSTAVADLTSNMVSQTNSTWLTIRRTSKMAFQSLWPTSILSVRYVPAYLRRWLIWQNIDQIHIAASDLSPVLADISHNAAIIKVCHRA